MNDRETYAQWLRTYNHLDLRLIVGALAPDDFDRMVRNMEERLGVNTWSVDRWAAAREEGA